MKQSSLISLFLFAILVLAGAGCRQESPVIPTTSTSPSDSSITDPSLAVNENSGKTSETPKPSEDPMPEKKSYSFQGTLSADQIENKQIRITTANGDIVFKLFADTAPNTVSNFVYLTSNGYYDGIIFHRVITGFMIQGGDPTGTGTSGPGYKFADELKDNRTYTRGIVAMANSGPNTNGSQFFIMHKDNGLPHSYSIFGEVIEGMDVVDAIAGAQTDRSDRPLTEIVMQRVIVEDAK